MTSESVRYSLSHSKLWLKKPGFYDFAWKRKRYTKVEYINSLPRPFFSILRIFGLFSTKHGAKHSVVKGFENDTTRNLVFFKGDIIRKFRIEIPRKIEAERSF